MARPKAQPETAGDRIRARRQAAGLSLIDLMGEVRARLPRPLWVTNETLRRYENGWVAQERMSPVLLAAIAAALGCEIAELSPSAKEEAAVVYDLLDAVSRWFLPVAACAG